MSVSRPPEPLPGCRIEASALYARGDNEEALACIDRALTQYVLPMETMRLREHVLRASTYLGTLLPHFEITARDHPDSADARGLLVSVSIKVGIFDVARRELHGAIARHPTVALHLDLADVEIRARDLDAAAHSIEAALALGPNVDDSVRVTELLLRSGALARARALAVATVKRAPQSSAARLALAWICLFQGDPRRAALSLSDLHPRPAGADHVEAAIAFVERRWEDADDLAARALKRTPDVPELRALRGAARYRLGAFEEAARLADRATYAEHGWLHGAHLVRKAAIIAHSREVALEPDFTALVETYRPVVPSALAFDPETDVKPERALAFLDHALDRISGNFTTHPTYLTDDAPRWRPLVPHDPPRVVCIQTFDHINGRPIDSVIDEMRVLHEKMPRSPYPHTHAAELLLWAGDYDGCDGECRAALALSKGAPSRWAWVGLGASLLLRSREHEALDVFAESERRLPTGAPLRAYRGEAFRRLGRLDEAEAELEKSLAIAPTRVSAWIQLALIANARKRFKTVSAIHAAIEQRVPLLLRDVTRDLRGTHDPRPPIVEEMVAIFEHALRVMAGNRSSQRITYRLRDGRMRLADGTALDVAT